MRASLAQGTKATSDHVLAFFPALPFTHSLCLDTNPNFDKAPQYWHAVAQAIGRWELRDAVNWANVFLVATHPLTGPSDHMMGPASTHWLAQVTAPFLVLGPI